MAVHTIEWQISQCLLGPDITNWDQVMDHFLKGLHDFCAYSHEVYFHDTFWPSYLHSRLNPYTSF